MNLAKLFTHFQEFDLKLPYKPSNLNVLVNQQRILPSILGAKSFSLSHILLEPKFSQKISTICVFFPKKNTIDSYKKRVKFINDEQKKSKYYIFMKHSYCFLFIIIAIIIFEWHTLNNHHIIYILFWRWFLSIFPYNVVRSQNEEKLNF